MIRQGQRTTYSLLAAFVIEPRPGQGYCVTKAEGPQAKNLEEKGLRLLDDLGDTDPGSSDVSHVLLGPLPNSNDLVAVTVALMPTGEAQYRQWWYRRQTSRLGRLAPWLYAAGLFVVGIMLGALVMGIAIDSGHLNKPIEKPQAVAEEEVRLRNSLAESKDLRRTLQQYVSSVVESAAPKGEVAQVKPARRLELVEREEAANGDVHAKAKRFTGKEVVQLSNLLKVLEDWERLGTANTN